MTTNTPEARNQRLGRAPALALAACLAALAPGKAAGAATAAAWRADIDQMVTNLERFNPDPFAQVGRLTFLREADALKRDLPQLSEEQRVVRVMRLMAHLNDRGTSVDVANPAFADWYPLRIAEFTDGYFVTSAYKTVADLAGAQVLEIAGQPVGSVADAARGLLSSDNAFARKERLFALHNAALMRGLGYAAADGGLEIKLKLRSGSVVVRHLTPQHADGVRMRKDDSSFAFGDYADMFGTPIGGFSDWISAYRNLPSTAFREPDTSRPPYLASRRLYYTRSLPEQSAYYVQVNALGDTRDETLLHFFQRALGEVDTLKPQRLIIDLRFNGGGDGSKATAVIHEFIQREAHRPWRELYVLTGNRTGGAAISLLSAFLKNTPVSLVGEPADTALNTDSDSRTFAFPDIGLKQNVTTARAQNSEEGDLSDTVQVNYPAPLSFADYTAGRDPALDPILKGDDRRSLTVIATADGGAAARKVYEARKSLRTTYPWWDDPRFIDIKQTAYVLLRNQRATDAVEVFKINVERYPDDWMSWENLGRGQTAAGLLAQARESYKCALAIDPENFDRGDLIAAIKEGGGDAAANLPAGCPMGNTSTP